MYPIIKITTYFYWIKVLIVLNRFFVGDNRFDEQRLKYVLPFIFNYGTGLFYTML